MKKLFVAVLVIGFGFFSCSLNPNTTVINDSSYPIVFRFSFYDPAVTSLNTQSSVSTKYFYTNIFIQPSTLLPQPEKRVTQNRNGGVITVEDLSSCSVRVENKTNDTVTLTAGGWMDDIVIDAGDIINDDSHKVYTGTPVFAVASSTFPYDVQWQLAEENGTSYFYVVIRD